ncbi:proline racemase family protein [Mycolicibacterium brisbanense]|uniref:Proline racemase n=1 Tax=Mycolicibacterium brisbanense TaxID=146020 RepID=A0A100VU40_9MYCO|nr:proline racemase family protein [Mycolicibacterium brisbanense]MCV7160469.1 proline racemase family protein [Mycolicibacterium brisbanense]GAS85933.1 proline racemase [Mycolicibacterium brisbanense]
MRLTNLVDVVGCHAEGEIGNVVVGGIGDVPGQTMFDKRNYLQKHRDELRQRLLHEPRGNVVRSTNVVLPSSNPKAAMGYVVMESTEYPVMSGSNTICVATVLLETGMVPMIEPITTLTLESPAGLIELECACNDGKVTSVRFINQPAFVYHLDAEIDVPGIGPLTVDVAWGGMAYVLVDAATVGLRIEPAQARDLCHLGQRIKEAAAEQLSAVHPVHPEYPGITQTEFTTPIERVDGQLTASNAVIVSPGRVDRSACGTGTSARLAVLHARGQIEPGEHFIHRSIIGTQFDGVIESCTTQGDLAAVVPSIAGQAWITDFTKVVLDPSDPFPTGYTVTDTWLAPISTDVVH